MSKTCMFCVPCVFQLVVQDVLGPSALRPAPVLTISSVIDLLGIVCVKVEEMTVNKV